MGEFDAIAEMEKVAHRSTANELAERALSKARCQLSLGRDAKSAFFATLVLRINTRQDYEIDTASTDGAEFAYNPDWWIGLTEKERIGVLAHEVLHVALAHHCRRGSRDLGNWNIACDLAINQVLHDSGFALPHDALYPGDGKYKDFDRDAAAEQHYSKLQEPKPDPEQQQGDGQCEGDDPGKCGGVRDAAQDESGRQKAESDAKIGLAMANESAKHAKGDLPAALSELVTEVLDPPTAWEEILRRFVERAIRGKDTYTYARPNRRYVPQGLYLPSQKAESLGHILVHVDTSGSCASYLPRFGGEVSAILGCNPCRLTVVYGDTQVQRVDTWEPSDGDYQWEAPLGGGTDHNHLLDWIDENQQEPPICVIALTDGYTAIRDEPPAMPVLWCVTPDGSAEALTFGEVVALPDA